MAVNDNKYLIALDIGTGSAKGLLYKIGGRVVCVRSQGYPTYYPGPGRVEQDPQEILEAVVKVVGNLVSDNGLDPGSVSGLVFGGILHSFLPVDIKGDPLSKAMIWGDSRSTSQSDKIRSDLDTEDIKNRTGCSIHPLYFLPRLVWLKEQAPGIFKKLYKIISIKEYIMLHLYGKFIVDRSIASGTGMLNMGTLDWDKDLMYYAGLKDEELSPVVETTFKLKNLRKEYASKITDIVLKVREWVKLNKDKLQKSFEKMIKTIIKIVKIIYKLRKIILALIIALVSYTVISKLVLAAQMASVIAYKLYAVATTAATVAQRLFNISASKGVASTAVLNTNLKNIAKTALSVVSKLAPIAIAIAAITAAVIALNVFAKSETKTVKRNREGLESIAKNLKTRSNVPDRHLMTSDQTK
ncbi:hypothetical protein LCGC14_2272020 [marine sediment metagenome]|uniref:Carbohydrate kinase FGGY N-terminal domain-containing protein n=1 Tax=marine sediment metagenome TaxID=412755 RepID=A0A0F9CWQ7_9ZZZZ